MLLISQYLSFLFFSIFLFINTALGWTIPSSLYGIQTTQYSNAKTIALKCVYLYKRPGKEVIKNTCDEQGSGICAYTTDNIFLLNMTIAGNSGNTQGVIFNGTGTSMNIRNSIVRESLGSLVNDAFVNISYSNLEYGESLISNNTSGTYNYGNGNIPN